MRVERGGGGEQRKDGAGDAVAETDALPEQAVRVHELPRARGGRECGGVQGWGQGVRGGGDGGAPEERGEEHEMAWGAVAPVDEGGSGGGVLVNGEVFCFVVGDGAAWDGGHVSPGFGGPVAERVLDGEEPFDGGEDPGPVGLSEGGGRVEEHVEDSR